MEKAKRKDTLKAFATVLIWFGVIGILLWAIAKSFGWIHSPTWVDMAPYLFGSGSLGGLAIYCGKVLNRLDRVEEDVKDIDGKVDEIIKDTSAIKGTIKAHEVQIAGLERDVYSNPSKETK